MLRITRATDYATRILASLCQAGDTPATAADLAAATGVSEEYVAKVIAVLKRRGWVTSQRGAAGGHSLVSPASHITLLQIVELFEGPLHLNECTGATGCEFLPRCPVHPVWLEAENELRRVLTRYNLAQLAARGQRQRLFAPRQ